MTTRRKTRMVALTPLARNSDIQHSKLCNAKYAEYEAFLAKYPKFCRACGGYGVVYEESTYDYPSFQDVCSACVGSGFCPLCAQDLYSHEQRLADEWNTFVDKVVTAVTREIMRLMFLEFPTAPAQWEAERTHNPRYGEFLRALRFARYEMLKNCYLPENDEDPLENPCANCGFEPNATNPQGAPFPICPCEWDYTD